MTADPIREAILNWRGPERAAAADSVLTALTDAIKDVCWKATPYGETEDDDTLAYLVPKGAMHRLIGAAQAVGIGAAFRATTPGEPE